MVVLGDTGAATCASDAGRAAGGIEIGSIGGFAATVGNGARVRRRWLCQPPVGRPARVQRRQGQAPWPRGLAAGVRNVTIAKV